MAEQDPQSLVVLGFKDQMAADEMLVALQRMTGEGTLLLRDAVFVTKNDKGKIKVVQTTDPSPGQAAWGGAFWGLLFGILLFVPVIGMAIGAGTAALIAKFVDTGISDDFVKQLRQDIEPGNVYLAVLVSHVNADKALEEMKRYSGMATVITTTLPAEGVEKLEAALGEVEVTHGVSEEESTIAPA
ncbi:MAG: DUF1269 domain-containing protein [Acidimicrobiales bacterium]|jgi:uncharacterized membrane protein|nr:DUF1269 domain-containing protein [Acidimicrobiales bacterium]